MTTILGVSHPWLLALLPLVLLPLLRPQQRALGYSWLGLLPPDRLSGVLDGLLRALGALAVGALVSGLAGLHRPPQDQEHIGQGAQMVVLLDRSSSMDRPFAGGGQHDPLAPYLGGRASAAKGQIARRLLAEFAASRNQDLYGMLMFSTNPIQVLPLTDKPALVQAAIAAGDSGRGLAKTNLGAGLTQALAFFADKPYTGSRIVLLISDGGARLDWPTQLQVEYLLRRHRVALYWLYIRSYGSPGLEAPLSVATAAEIAPEQLLHRFFQQLDTPYRAYSAENPQALQQAIDDVGRLQTLPIRYHETIPKRELSAWCYGAALGLLALLALARFLELPSWRPNAA